MAGVQIAQYFIFEKVNSDTILIQNLEKDLLKCQNQNNIWQETAQSQCQSYCEENNSQKVLADEKLTICENKLNQLRVRDLRMQNKKLMAKERFEIQELKKQNENIINSSENEIEKLNPQNTNVRHHQFISLEITLSELPLSPPLTIFWNK